MAPLLVLAALVVFIVVAVVCFASTGVGLLTVLGLLAAGFACLTGSYLAGYLPPWRQ